MHKINIVICIYQLVDNFFFKQFSYIYKDSNNINNNTNATNIIKI